MEDLKQQLETKNELIETLEKTLKLKEEQISTIQSSFKLKNDQISTMETSLKFKEDKIETLEKTLKLKEEQITSGSGDSSQTEGLQKEIDVLNDELSKSDEEVERLESEIEKLSSQSSDSKIIDFTNIKITKLEIIEKMRNILTNALHNVIIVVPDIVDLQDLYLYEVRSSVNMKISCLINPGIEDHSELLEELESLDNISLRTYDSCDRYIIDKDGEEVFMAIIGEKEDNHLTFQTMDPKHIQFCKPMVMETWLRSRRI